MWKSVIEPFKIEFFLNGRYCYLFSEGGLKIFHLLLLKVVSSMLQLTLKIFLSFVLCDFGVILHPFFSDHCLTVHPLGSIGFSFCPFFVTFIVLVDGWPLLAFFLPQLKSSHLNIILYTRPRSIFSRRYPNCWILVCSASTVCFFHLAKVYCNLSVAEFLYTLSSPSVLKVGCWVNFSCLMLWFSSAQ